jgi:4-alpha-glucanotransferase
VFDAARRELGPLPLIAEDLGVITPAVTRLRDALGLPGMLVLQFGFDPSDPHGPHRIERFRRRAIAYTSTHDSDTLRGWLQTLPPERRREVDAAVASYDDREPWWRLMRLCADSPAQVSMVQAQDVLGLGSEARMNVPGRATGSWRWRMRDGALTRALARRLREVTAAAGRLP